MKITLVQTALFLCFFSSLSFSSCQSNRSRSFSSTSGSNQDPLQIVMDEVSKREPFFGNILVKKGDEILLERSYGYADLRWNQKNTKDSKFMLASVSKQFTASAISTLVLEGKVSYSDPLSKYLPLELVHSLNIEAFKKITIRDLLSHEAGLLKDPQADFININQRYRLRELAEKLLQDERLISHERGQFKYSNVGYILLARVVEVVTKFKFEDYLKFKVLGKIGLKESGVYHRSKIIPRMATGYYRDEDEKFQAFCCSDSSTSMGSHNLFSSARDLALWVDELTKRNKVIGKEFLDFSRVRPQKGVQYFNGLFRKETSSGFHYWHDGFSGGYASRISFFPQQELTIVILLNRVNVFTAQPHIEAIHEELVKVYR